MKKIIGYLRDHLKADFKWGYYLTMGIFLAFILALNYGLHEFIPEMKGKTIERYLRREHRGNEYFVFHYLLFYGIPYYFGLACHIYFHEEFHLLRSKEFWLKTSFGMFVLSIDVVFYYHDYLYELPLNAADRYFLRRCAVNLVSYLCVFVPLYLFWKWYEDKHKIPNFYGLTVKGFEWQPYAWMMLLMVPLVVGASFNQDFSSYYPRIKLHRIEGMELLPQWAAIGTFEFLYGADFVWTELIFRGFLVIGLAGVLGKGTVLPMASVYCARHFAKPLGESISSIFGGYILGVIALRSKNILGGVFIHMGIALLMELMAFLQILVIKG
ncbi:MAG: CPBP family intramembrane glutamic endopeptidase [Bacteroidota bacterium]